MTNCIFSLDFFLTSINITFGLFWEGFNFRKVSLNKWSLLFKKKDVFSTYGNNFCRANNFRKSI